MNEMRENCEGIVIDVSKLSPEQLLLAHEAASNTVFIEGNTVSDCFGSKIWIEPSIDEEREDFCVMGIGGIKGTQAYISQKRGMPVPRFATQELAMGWIIKMLHEIRLTIRRKE